MRPQEGHRFDSLFQQQTSHDSLAFTAQPVLVAALGPRRPILESRHDLTALYLLPLNQPTSV
eukprot:scaffold268683_cov33-Tisochrysis_lutea.AAC.3